VPEDADVVYGMFLVNSIPASVLFDSGAAKPKFCIKNKKINKIVK
jgi:hypothetical protein